MNNIGSTKPSGSLESLIWQAQGAAKDIELSTKRDLAIESQNKFDEAVEARRTATDARFAKGGKENKNSFWSNVGMIAGLAAAAVVAVGLSVFSAGLSVAAIGALIAFAGGTVGGLAKLGCYLGFERSARNDERRASENDIRATEAQRAADDAKEEAQAAHDRFRSILDDARTIDQTKLRAFQRD